MHTFTGVLPFWRGNLASCFTCLSLPLSFILKHKVNALFNSHAVKFTKNIASGSLAGAISLSLIYSLDYAPNRLANDVKDGLKGNSTVSLMSMLRRSEVMD